MMMTRPLEMAADRARDVRQTGLTANVLQDINKNTEEEQHRVQNYDEVEKAYVRTDAESEGKSGGQEPRERQRKEKAAGKADLLRRQAAERLLNLPVSNDKHGTEDRRFDMRV